jgi:hypothetical protein
MRLRGAETLPTRPFSLSVDRREFQVAQPRSPPVRRRSSAFYPRQADRWAYEQAENRRAVREAPVRQASPGAFWAAVATHLEGRTSQKPRRSRLLLIATAISPW